MKKWKNITHLIHDHDAPVRGNAINFDRQDIVFYINPNDPINKLIKLDDKPT
jgi:hypothetical protein